MGQLKNKKNLYLFIFFSLIFNSIKSQQNRTVNFYKNLNYSHSEKIASNHNNGLINEYLLELVGQGFLNVGKDSVISTDNDISVYVSTGTKFKLNPIQIKFSENELLIQSFFDSKKLTLEPITFSKKINKWLVHMNNNGFPFAKFEFDQSTIDSEKLNVICKLSTGPLVKIDSLYNPEMSEKEISLISKIIKIKKGQIFNLSKINEISSGLEKVKYLTQTKSPAYEFINDKATIYTYAKGKSINNINGLIGIQPSNDGNIQFTGNVTLSFLNALKHGEMLDFNWRKMFNASQNLIASFAIPYIFKTDFEIKGKLNMIKKDSSFFNISSKVNVNYILNSNYSLGIVYDLVGSTNLLESEYNSTSTNNFGFNFYRNKLNDIYNPKKGFFVNWEILTGIKKTYFNENNQEIINITPNYYSELRVNKYLPISKRTTSKVGLNVMTTLNDNLFENELTRIGGYQTLRGFDEESIFVSSYLIGNLEFRYLIDQRSNVFLFTDFAWTEKNTKNKYEQNSYNSLGFGTNLSLNNGLLTLVYGLGSEVGENFMIRTGKIHLGFTSYF